MCVVSSDHGELFHFWSSRLVQQGENGGRDYPVVAGLRCDNEWPLFFSRMFPFRAALTLYLLLIQLDGLNAEAPIFSRYLLFTM